MKTVVLALLLFVILPLRADDAAWVPTKDASRDAVINGREMETFKAGVRSRSGAMRHRSKTPSSSFIPKKIARRLRCMWCCIRPVTM